MFQNFKTENNKAINKFIYYIIDIASITFIAMSFCKYFMVK